MVMRLHCERNVEESIRKCWLSSILVLVCTARFWNHQNDKKFGPVLVKLQALYTERCIWDYATRARHYQVQKDIIIYQIYQLVGGISAKFVSSRISQNIFFYMIGKKSFHFIFWGGGGGGRFQNWSLRSLPLKMHCHYYVVITGYTPMTFAPGFKDREGLSCVWVLGLFCG